MVPPTPTTVTAYNTHGWFAIKRPQPRHNGRSSWHDQLPRVCPHQSKHARRLAVPPMVICSRPLSVPREMGGGEATTYPTQSVHRQGLCETTLPPAAKYPRPIIPSSHLTPAIPHHRRTRTSRDQREIAVPIHTAVARAPHLSPLEPGISSHCARREAAARARARSRPIPSHPILSHLVPRPAQSSPYVPPAAGCMERR